MTAPNQLRDRSAEVLGPIVSSHRPRTSSIVNSVDIWGGCSIVIFGMVVVVMAALGLSALLGIKGTPGNVMAILTVGLLVAMLVAWIRWARRFARIGVDVHEGGLVVSRGGRRDVIRWDDIEALRWIPVSMRGAAALGSSIRLTDGREITLPSLLPGAVELGGVVEHEVAVRKLPAALAAFRSGHEVAFGTADASSATISHDGISIRGKQFAWADVISVGIKSGVDPQLVVTWRGGRFRNEAGHSLSRIDNVAILLAIVRTIPGIEVG